MRQKADPQSEQEANKRVESQQEQLPETQKLAGQGRSATLRQLQRTRGNRYVQRLLKKGTLQRSAATGEEMESVPPAVHETLNSSGRPLDSSTQQFMESRFGEDFGHVQVHTDGKAAQSADAVNARAYTVGSDIVFAEGQYSPGTTEGNKVIAHELTHVSQQGGAGGNLQGLKVGPTDSPEEHEADAVADAVVTGGAVPETSAGHQNATVRRTVAGGVGGGLIGAGAGAVLGGLMGGVAGAIVGGLLGAVVGLAAGDAATSPRRRLTQPEKDNARLVFGNSIDLDSIQLAEAPIMSIGGFARTLPGIIYFPPGQMSIDFETEFMPFLIHEMTHIWQYQHGISLTTTLFHAIRGKYDYKGEAGLLAARREGKHFLDFNTEQQGDICSDYYKIKKGVAGAPDNHGPDAWQPFIDEVQGTKPGADVTKADPTKGGATKSADRFTTIG